ncbi:MAG: FGGY family carbohydrate kinase [Actinobacteria bacterium]|nr:FGGY family carbohydrate kinase [Actinomycetota bacterium]
MGIDIGTTGAKAVAFSPDGKILASAYGEYSLKSPNPGWNELDPKEVWDIVSSAIKRAAGEVKIKDPVKALSVSVLGVCCLPVDRKGNHLYNSIIAMDSRTIPQSKWWESKMDRLRIYEITGEPLHPMNSLLKIQWWRENMPDIYKRAWKFLCWQDYFFLKVGLEPTIDYSLASGTMAFDLRKFEWSKEILEIAEVDESKLAVAKPSGAIVGELPNNICDELNLARGCMAVTGGYDQVCATIGVGAVQIGMAMNNLGTAEPTGVIMDERYDSKAMLKNNFIILPHPKMGLYMGFAYNFGAGSLLRWYRDTFARWEVEQANAQGINVYDLILSDINTGVSKIFIVPHIMGSGTPYVDPQAKGLIYGFSISTKKSDLVKAIIEAPVYEVKLMIECMKEAGIDIEELLVTGGGAKSDKWMQLKADMTGCTVKTPECTEAGSLGVMMLASVAAGIYKSLDQAVKECVRFTKVYHPDRKLNLKYDEAYKIYKGLYPAVRDFGPRIDMIS